MTDLIIASNTTLALRPSPIEPSWIIEGNPIARNAVLDSSADGMASTIVWDCSEGRFNWYYDIDETIHILEGSIVVDSDTMPATRFGPGDVITFKKGAHARWHVEGYVRKLAFCRRTQPRALGLALRVAGKLKSVFAGSGSRQPASLLDAR